MVDSAGKLVLDVIKRDCTTSSCPYTHGDRVAAIRVTPKLDKKLIHRVSDGNEVRKLDEKLKIFEVEILRIINSIEYKRPLGITDVERLKKLLRSKIS